MQTDQLISSLGVRGVTFMPHKGARFVVDTLIA